MRPCGRIANLGLSKFCDVPQFQITQRWVIWNCSTLNDFGLCCNVATFRNVSKFENDNVVAFSLTKVILKQYLLN